MSVVSKLYTRIECVAKAAEVEKDLAYKSGCNAIWSKRGGTASKIANATYFFGKVTDPGAAKMLQELCHNYRR
jgi:hypothetical protein